MWRDYALALLVRTLSSRLKFSGINESKLSLSEFS